MPGIASTGDIDESPGITGPSVPSPLHTRPYGEAKKTKDREPFYIGYGVVYLPGDINGLAKKLQVTPKSGTNWFMYWMRCLD